MQFKVKAENSASGGALGNRNSPGNECWTKFVGARPISGYPWATLIGFALVAAISAIAADDPRSRGEMYFFARSRRWAAVLKSCGDDGSHASAARLPPSSAHGKLRRCDLGGQMNRLQKFVEQGAYGERPGRTAYAFNATMLPEPTAGLDWRPVAGFSAGDEVLKERGLKTVFQTAIKRGFAIASRN
ncbi:hypothetical protein GPL21_33450 [Bradyrhizobium pachyrhizi]|uniref:Uncharacterized protein n=1 Tax=Bradyrhizobium pachyrhizi TaxID=280333 RepID=A0A844T4L1_9BRAD|nr:hypothetical protein [Bradyrhizobium pachyrhizi]MVT69991.1 hypothetical protein [Bradyrhizobium pachyrhizi]